ncbi:MAG: hypothetical protein LBD35_03235 [Prevotellaceae bacterium]|jgi:hypothetical protein|nr:hypothetical protein [Prevotellaceae bacterium]
MKLKELLDQLSELSPDYNEVELEMSVMGKYEEHNLSLKDIVKGTRGYDENLRKKKNGRSGYLFCKVTDTGTYTLLDENDGVVKK